MALNDPLLTPLLEANDAASRQQALEIVLLERVQPVVARVLGSYRAAVGEDNDDLAANINVRLIRRLQRLAGSLEVIEHLDDYVATLTYNAIYDYLRRRYPERMRLRNRLRYIFGHDDRFAIWDLKGETICGLARWRDHPAVAATLLAENATQPMRERDKPGDALRAMFDRAGGPILFDDVVRIAAELWHITDGAAGDRADYEARSLARSPAVEMETRQSVEALWKEVQELRSNQRVALLMNLRELDGTNGLALLLIAGVATIEEIAAAINMSVEELSEIWNELPLDDLRIGELLHLTRQQVINLRKSARERLSRRMVALHKRRQ